MAHGNGNARGLEDAAILEILRCFDTGFSDQQVTQGLGLPADKQMTVRNIRTGFAYYRPELRSVYLSPDGKSGVATLEALMIIKGNKLPPATYADRDGLSLNTKERDMLRIAYEQFKANGGISSERNLAATLDLADRLHRTPKSIRNRLTDYGQNNKHFRRVNSPRRGNHKTTATKRMPQQEAALSAAQLEAIVNGLAARFLAAFKVK